MHMCAHYAELSLINTALISVADLTSVMNEREKLTQELNQTDSTTTSEALGAIKTSVQQMKMGVTMLKGKITNIEQETANVMQESDAISKQQRVSERVVNSVIS